MKTLTLNLKHVYFDQILAGEKTHEYRDIFPENVRYSFITPSVTKNSPEMLNFHLRNSAPAR